MARKVRTTQNSTRNAAMARGLKSRMKGGSLPCRRAAGAPHGRGRRHRRWLHTQALRDCGPPPAEGESVPPDHKLRGIRPAFGYPACPDHSLKGPLHELLQAPGVDIELTETYAMEAAASVSGLLLLRPEAWYFVLGAMGDDQLTA